MVNQEQQIQAMQDCLAEQKKAFAANSNCDVSVRIDRLKKLRHVMFTYRQEFVEAISKDFTNRSFHETYIGEIQLVIDHIDLTIKHLPKWMRNEKRKVGLVFQPGKAWVQYQPLGVVGIISPWNYPITLSIGPLICALAAGNHAMIKPSSAVPNYAALVAEKLAEVFPAELVTVIQGSGELSKAFSKMPFNQMTFTGSSNVGKTIMKDASANLTPVLLELGGKSPTIVHESFDLQEFAARLCIGKLWNAGQTCVAPDYVMLAQGKTEEFVKHMTARITQCYPTIANNVDYTAMISQSAKQNLLDVLEDARAKGATIVECNPANESFEDTQKIPPTFVYNTTEDMRICQEEIFGPLILVKEYTDIDDALKYVNEHPRPLALYYFDFNKQRSNYVAMNTISGHFGNNQVLTHVAQDDLPFGGVGSSGMGKYHGIEGFKTMSNARSSMSHGKIYPAKLLAPPFRQIHELFIKTFVR